MSRVAYRSICDAAWASLCSWPNQSRPHENHHVPKATGMRDCPECPVQDVGTQPAYQIDRIDERLSLLVLQLPKSPDLVGLLFSHDRDLRLVESLFV